MQRLLLVTAITLVASFAQTLAGSKPAAAGESSDTTVAGSLFIHGGWLFDGISDKRRRNSGIFISEGKFTAIDVPRKSNLQNQPIVIELTDSETILPGLIDLHAHYNLDFIDKGRVEEARYNGLVFLANGVTTTWSAGEFYPERIINQRNRIESGNAIGPRLLSSGPYFGAFRCEYSIKVAEDECIAWPNDITEQEIRDEVDKWAGKGVVSIKIKQATPAEAQIIIDQAQKNGLTTTGHLANYNVEYDVSTRDAIRMGIDRIEHQLTLALSPEDARATELGEIVDLMIQHQVFYDANLQMYGGINLRRSTMSEMTWIDESKYFTPYAQKLLKQRGPPPPESAWPEFNQRIIELNALYKAGGANLLIIGTDEPVYTSLLPGFAYHRELLALSNAGLPPVVVLKAATINGATALGMSDKLGSIETGKLADLIVVNGNPLENIKTARNLQWVIQEGTVHDPQALLRSAEGKIGPSGEQDHSNWKLVVTPLRQVP
jgi:imidazolonepropionase-like amidohydrolase